MLERELQIGIVGGAQLDLHSKATRSRRRGVPLDQETVGDDDRGSLPSGTRRSRGWNSLGQVGGRVPDGRGRAILALAAQHIKARVQVAVDRLVELIEDIRA